MYNKNIIYIPKLVGSGSEVICGGFVGGEEGCLGWVMNAGVLSEPLLC